MNAQDQAPVMVRMRNRPSDPGQPRWALEFTAEQLAALVRLMGTATPTGEPGERDFQDECRRTMRSHLHLVLTLREAWVDYRKLQRDAGLPMWEWWEWADAGCPLRP